MFQTDINHWLQQFDSKLIYCFLEGVSYIGTIPVLMLLVYVLLTGVNLRKGMWVVNIFCYVVILTVFMKEIIDYPRPLAVDTTLENFGRETGQNFRQELPQDFFGLFSDDVLSKIRQNDVQRHGFPSGHTSSITAFFLGVALIFRKRWQWLLGLSLVVLTMISRMYLGLHFLGDVLGGLLVGLLPALLITAIFRQVYHKQNENAQTIFFLLPLALLPFAPWLNGFQLGVFVGLNIAFLLVRKVWGLPDFRQRGMKNVLCVVIFFTLGFISIYISRRLGFSGKGFLSVLVFSLVGFTSFILSAFICIKSKLWKKMDIRTTEENS